MDDETKRKISRHKIRTAKVPPDVMRFVRQSATPQLAASLLKRYDAKEITAEDFVELLRVWLRGDE